MDEPKYFASPAPNTNSPEAPKKRRVFMIGDELTPEEIQEMRESNKNALVELHRIHQARLAAKTKH